MFFQRAQSCLDGPSGGWKDTVEVNGYLDQKEFARNGLNLLSLAVQNKYHQSNVCVVDCKTYINYDNKFYLTVPE